MELISEIERMLFASGTPVNNGPRVSHPTWNNRTVAHVVTSNESDEQIGEARWSVSAISSIALGAELQCSVVLARRTLHSLEITMNRRCRRTHVNFSQSLAHFRLTIDEFFNLLARDVIVTLDRSISRRLLVSLSFDYLLNRFKIHSRYVASIEGY